MQDFNEFMYVIKGMRRLFVYFYFISFFIPVSAETDVVGFDRIASAVFWEELYTYGGWTLYCGYRFESDKKIEMTRSVTIEHIYPTHKMLEQLGCESRMQCRESGNSFFVRMEADMHNMYPVWHALVTYRYGKEYGLVEGEERRIEDCDIEWQAGVIEPRPLARGNIARSLLYMYKEYNLYLEPDTIRMLVQWHREDPPSNQEIERNDRIESIQGLRNPYIDVPSRAENLIESLN